MANMVEAIWLRAVAFASGWLRGAVLIVFIRNAGVRAWSWRVASRRWASARRLPPVGQQLLAVLAPAAPARRLLCHSVHVSAKC